MSRFSAKFRHQNSHSLVLRPTPGLVAALIVAVVFPSLATGAVGTTPGQFSVDADGAATYTIPIRVATGVNGMAPTLGLSYSSQAGDGLAGAGWDIVGISSIDRCPKTVATNGEAQGGLTNNYCLDGQPLVRDASNASGAVYGADGTLYRTEMDSYVRVKSYGSTGGAPTYFVAQQPNGMTYYYRAAIPVGSGSGSPVRSWKISQIQDKFFNSIRFTYKDGTEDFNPSEITWSDHCATAGCTSGTGARYKVAFEYESRPTSDQRSGYVEGSAWTRIKRLHKITYSADAATVQDFTLQYVASSGTGRSELTSVTQCGDATTGCYPATTFGWADKVAGWGTLAAATTYWPSSDAPRFSYGDFDGDGRTDILFQDSANNGKWSILRATGSRTAPFFSRIDTTTPWLSDPVVADFDADGRSDVLGKGGAANWVLHRSTGSDFTIVQTDIPSTTMPAPSALDYNADGLPDLVYARGSSIYMRPNTAGTFSANDTEITATGLTDYIPASINLAQTDDAIPTGDFDGDGRADLLVYSHPASGNDRWLAFAYTGTPASPGSWGLIGLTPINVNATHAQVLDVNGDGLSDLAYYVPYGSSSAGWSTMISNGATFSAPQLITGSAGVTDNDTTLAAVDYNGDGRDDVIISTPPAGMAKVYLSDGAVISSTPVPGIALGVGFVVPIDIDGNGADDLLGGTLTTGGGGGGGCGGFNPCIPNFISTWKIAFDQTAAGNLVPSGDRITSITDGLQNSVTQITYKPLSNNGVYTATTSGADVPSPALAALKNHLVRGSGEQVVSQYTQTDGVGGSNVVTHHYTNQWVNTEGRGSLGFRTIDRTGGPSGSFSTSTKFRQDHPFTGSVVEEAACQQPGVCSVSSGTRVSTSVRTFSSQSSQLGTDPNNHYHAVWESVSERQDYDNDGSTVLKTTKRDVSGLVNGVPAWNVTIGAPNTETLTTRAGVAGSLWTTTRSYTYADNALVGLWCLGLPTLVAETRSAPSTVPLTHSEGFNYASDESRCVVRSHSVGSGRTYLSTSFQFTADGNVSSRTESSGIPVAKQRLTTYEYVAGPYHPSSETRLVTEAQNDLCGQQLVPASTLQTSYTWDYRLGLLKRVTSPQGVATERGYDSFGRPTTFDEVTRGKSTTTNYAACVGNCFPVGSAFRASSIGTDGSGSTLYFDSLGRQVGSASKLLGGAESWQEVQYNALGQIAHQSVPRLANATKYDINLFYDELGRVKKEARPTGQNISESGPTETVYDYSALATTITDPELRKRKLMFNPNGTLAEVREDPDGINATTTYQYTAFGQLEKITDAGSTAGSGGGTFTRWESTFQYDGRGFLISRQDNDRGTWTFDYDAWGDLESQTHPKGRQDLSYDAVGRLFTRTDTPSGTTTPQLETTWEYYANAGGKTGQLKQVTTGAYYKQSYSYYDSGSMQGLPQQSQTFFPSVFGTTPFVTDYGYDSLGRLSSLKYPVAGQAGRFEAVYNYDGTGHLSQVCQGSGGLCTNSIYAVGDGVTNQDSVDPLGRITRAKFGASSAEPTEAYAFDPANLQLSGISTVGSGSTIQDYDYWWDRSGNLARRDRPGVQEKFYYDPLNRLDYVTRTAGAATATTMDLSYDPNGNIVSKLAGGTGSDVGTYHYGTTGGGPHAVSNISGTRGGTFHYDPAGNLDCNSWSGGACNSGSSIVWSSYNLPTRINYGGTANYSDFLYGPSRERVRTSEHEGSGTRAVYRVGEYFEIEITWGLTSSPDGIRYRSMVYFGDRMVYARVDDDLEAAALQQGYVHLDHLGSVDRVTSFDGLAASSTSYSFDAFGKRRNAGDWSNDDSDARFADKQWLERGFTGHEQLDVVRLIHMNGRVQNPIWGRMLSPDPVLGDLASPQNLNAYSYVANNPGRFTDPTGYVNAKAFPGFDGIGGPTYTGENAQIAEIVVTAHGNNSDPCSTNTSICDPGAIADFTDELLSRPTGALWGYTTKVEAQLRILDAINKAVKAAVTGRRLDPQSGALLKAVADRISKLHGEVNNHAPDWTSIGFGSAAGPGGVITVDRYGQYYVGAAVGVGYPALGVQFGWLDGGPYDTRGGVPPSAEALSSHLTQFGISFGAGVGFSGAWSFDDFWTLGGSYGRTLQTPGSGMSWSTKVNLP